MNAPVDIDPFARDALAQRLHTLDIPTPEALTRVAPEPGPPPRSPARRYQRMRRFWQVGAAGVVAVSVPLLLINVFHAGSAGPLTVHVPGYTIEVVAAAEKAPRLNRVEATRVALDWLKVHPVASGPPYGQPVQLTDFEVVAVTYESHVVKVWHQCGAHWFLNSPQDLWVIDLRAPAQLGWVYVQASVLVNDDTAKAQYTDALTGKTTPAGC